MKRLFAWLKEYLHDRKRVTVSLKAIEGNFSADAVKQLQKALADDHARGWA